MNKFFMTGYCLNDRKTGIADIKQIINKYGFIIDFKMYSDITLSIIIETAESKIDSLFSDLKKYMKMNDFEQQDTDSNKECTIYLNVTFIKGTGDLRIITPSVPG